MNELLRAEWPCVVNAVARAVGDRELAEDAVQEACLKALRAFGSRTGPSAKAWFMAIVRNASMDAMRGHRRRKAHDSFDEEAHSFAGGGDSPESAAERASESRWVRDAISHLPLEYREVLVLREIEEMTYKEISAIVRIPIGTVMSRLTRGRDLLAQRLRAALLRRAK
jgi:RNA polymerase sigma-70 factor (ECF subfamily)